MSKVPVLFVLFREMVILPEVSPAEREEGIPLTVKPEGLDHRRYMVELA